MMSKWISPLMVIFIMLVGFVSLGVQCNKAEQETKLMQIELDGNKILLEDKTSKLDEAYQNISEITEKYTILKEEFDLANATIQDLKNQTPRLVYLGNFKLTHYCTEIYEHICGTGTGLTATGTQVTADRTIAVDPTVIPYGAQVYIEGYGWYIAEDCGGAVKGNHIDIAVSTHEQALSLGTTNGGVWILIQ